jgi:hypothetical protein
MLSMCSTTKLHPQFLFLFFCSDFGSWQWHWRGWAAELVPQKNNYSAHSTETHLSPVFTQAQVCFMENKSFGAYKIVTVYHCSWLRFTTENEGTALILKSSEHRPPCSGQDSGDVQGLPLMTGQLDFCSELVCTMRTAAAVWWGWGSYSEKRQMPETRHQSSLHYSSLNVNLVDKQLWSDDSSEWQCHYFFLGKEKFRRARTV